MVRDGITNVVYQFGERGYTPRKVGHDAWESRCLGHRSSDHALSITRNEFNHVVLECRTTENCQHMRIIRALGFTNEHVYAETPDRLIRRLSGFQIQPASFKASSAKGDDEPGTSAIERMNGSAGILLSHEGEPSADVEMTETDFEPGGDDVALVVSAGPAPSPTVVKTHDNSTR
jgi:hypothetical protein